MCVGHCTGELGIVSILHANTEHLGIMQAPEGAQIMLFFIQFGSSSRVGMGELERCTWNLPYCAIFFTKINHKKIHAD